MRVKTQPEFSLGYNRFGSHELEPIEECPISSPLINRAIAAVWDFGRGGRMPGSVREIEFFGNAQDSQMMLAVMVQSASRSESTQAGSWKAQPFADELLRVVTAAAGVVVFEEREPREEPRVLAVAGSQFLEYLTATASYRVSAGAFFQVNRFLTDELVRIVTEGYTGRMALDLYAGVGLFSTLLARQFERVVAVESSPQSFADLAYNSPGNVKPIRASVEQHLGKAGGKGRADLVVVDPPRAGLGIKVAKSIAELQAPNLAYVSCDPATLARDLIPLLGAGYRVEQAHMVDLFPQTFHLESVVKLGRSSS
jgi:23S rRNA (uracil1939-C5)-methyltransferase